MLTPPLVLFMETSLSNTVGPKFPGAEPLHTLKNIKDPKPICLGESYQYLPYEKLQKFLKQKGL